MNATKTMKPTLEEKAAHKAAETCLKVALRATDERLQRVAYQEAAELYKVAGAWALADWCLASL